MELEKRGRRDKSLLIQRLWKWFSIMPTWTYWKLLDNHVLDDVKYHNQFFSLLLHTFVSKYIRLQNSPCITMHEHSTTWGSSNHHTSYINYTARKHTHDKLNKCWYSPAVYTVACQAMSSPIIVHLINGSLSTFLKDVLAMKQFEAQGPHKMFRATEYISCTCLL